MDTIQRPVLLTSIEFIKASLNFLRTNKDLLILPIISLIIAIVFLGLLLTTTGYAFPHFVNLYKYNPWLLVGILIICYFAFSAIIIFFNAALIATTVTRLQGQRISIIKGLLLATKRIVPIIGWSIMSASIGVLIRALESSHSMIKEIVGYILGTSWSIAAYFVVPILVLENMGPYKALRHSIKIFGSGWKKVISVNFIIGFIALIFILALVFFIHLLPGRSEHLIELSVFIVILIALLASIFSSTLNAIITSALYLNIIKQIRPKTFDPKLLTQAFIQRKY